MPVASSTTAVASYVAADPFVSALVETTGALSTIASKDALRTASQNYNDEAFSYYLGDGLTKSEEAIQAHFADIAARNELYGVAARRAYSAGEITKARNFAMKDLLWHENNPWDRFDKMVAPEVFSREELLDIFQSRYDKFSLDDSKELAAEYLRQIDKLFESNSF